MITETKSFWYNKYSSVHLTFDMILHGSSIVIAYNILIPEFKQPLGALDIDEHHSDGVVQT